jgi:hypothetical protein
MISASPAFTLEPLPATPLLEGQLGPYWLALASGHPMAPCNYRVKNSEA